jgi:REP element-mobilizing transposase RayT
MPHTYTNLLVHYVFSTKERKRHIPAPLQPGLWSYLAGCAKTHGIRPVAIGGTDDHCHALLALPSDKDVAKVAQLIKGGSSKWFREKHVKDFSWQQGYGAFSVSASQKEKTVSYIANQEKHHKKMTFETEFISLLKKHDIEYDPKYVFG